MEHELAALVLVVIGMGVLMAVRAQQGHEAAQQDRLLVHKERMALARAEQIRAATQPQYPMLHTLNMPYSEVERKGLPVPPPIIDVPIPQLPGPVTLGQVQAGGWRPSVGEILLGLAPDGVRVTVPVGDLLCHVVTAGKTGSGKSNTLRLLLTQLAAVGAEYYICDPHFTPVNPTTGDDWRALAAASQPHRALTSKAEIVALVDGLAAEVDTRLARWHTGAHPGPARFYLFEELPSLADTDKDFMKKLGRLLREGRKLGLFIITAAQDMLISTVGGSAGLRSQFATVYYGGGDPYTARALLAVKVAEPAGKGVCWLRSVTDTEPRQVRVPLVTNADITALLGSAGRDGSGPRGTVIEGHFAPIADPASVASVPASPPFPVASVPLPPMDDAGKRQQVRALVRAGVKSSAIIAEVWGATGGRAYTQAADELTAILAELVP